MNGWSPFQLKCTQQNMESMYLSFYPPKSSISNEIDKEDTHQLAVFKEWN